MNQKNQSQTLGQLSKREFTNLPSELQRFYYSIGDVFPERRACNLRRFYNWIPLSDVLKYFDEEFIPHVLEKGGNHGATRRLIRALDELKLSPSVAAEDEPRIFFYTDDLKKINDLAAITHWRSGYGSLQSRDWSIKASWTGSDYEYPHWQLSPNRIDIEEREFLYDVDSLGIAVTAHFNYLNKSKQI